MIICAFLLSLFCVVNIPLTITEEGLPKVTAVVDGKEVEAWIDLGRGIALIQESKFPKGLIQTTQTIVGTQGFNDVVKKQNVIQIPSLQLGGYTFVDVKGTPGVGQITSYSISSNNTSTHNNTAPPLMLGNDIFTNGVLLVDYKSGFFEYGKDINEFSKEIPFKKWALVPFKIDHGQIQFLALLHGLSGFWILDSGSTMNLIYKGFMGPLKFTQGENQTLNLGRFGFELDNLYYTNKPLKTGIYGIAGAPFIKKNRILIDFRKKHLYVEPQ